MSRMNEHSRGDIVSMMTKLRRMVNTHAYPCSGNVGRATHLPSAEQLDDEVVAVPLVQQLRDEVQVGDQGRLQDDGHVGGVEQLDLVVLLHAAALLVADWQVHMEPL